MATALSIMYWALVAWLGAMAALVGYRLLWGGRPLLGLLSNEGRSVDPERVQALLVVLFVAGAYIVTAMGADHSSRTMPDLPEGLLALLAGSEGLYLGGKLARSARGP
jgi:hypothetical protein